MAERLRWLDLVTILRVVNEIRAARDVESFRRETLRGLRRVIGADNAGYNDLDFQTQRITWVDDPVGVSRFPGCDDILSRHLFENPVAAHFAKGRDERCLKISDFMSIRAWQRTAVYNEFYRKIDTDHQLGLVFPDGHSSIAIVLNRRGPRDFCERDRTILTLLRPHIVQGSRDASLVTDLHADIASLATGVDSTDVGLVLLDEHDHIRLATTKARHLIAAYFDGGPRSCDALPGVLEAWVRREQMNADRGIPGTVCMPYVVHREDGRLVVRLIGGRERRLLIFWRNDSASMSRL